MVANNLTQSIKSLFLSGGTLLYIWRTLIFFWIGNIFFYFEGPFSDVVADRFPVLIPFTFEHIIFLESFNLINAIVCTALFAWYEHRRIDDYGLPFSRAFKGPFWEGVLVGTLAVGLVGLGMLALHGWVIQGFNLSGTGWILFPAGWIVANIVVGLAEESWYRGYMLHALTKSVGFWPAAVALSLLFTSDHYFFKKGENIYDVITLFSFGIFLCLSFRRTGSLWFAVGFHAAFDLMQLFVIGTPNGTAQPVGALFKSAFPGPAWVNGGALGTEASVLMYPVLVLLFAYLVWRYPRNQALE